MIYLIKPLNQIVIGYYTEKGTTCILEENARYIISFDYVIHSNTSPLYLTFGYGSKNNKAWYATDMKERTLSGSVKTIAVYYPTGSKSGNITYVLETSTFDPSYNIPYLSLRLARMSTPGDFNVEIANFRFKKAPDDLQPGNSIYEKQLSLVGTSCWYKEYYSSILLEPDTQYNVSFDYEVVSASSVLGCGIGYGREGKKTKSGS